MEADKVEILATTDYDQFHFLEGNRPFNKGLLLIIEDSILNDGDYLKYNPGIVNEKGEIIDGQHRWRKAKDMGLAWYYQVAPGFGLKEAILFNSRKREWRARDYLNAFLSQNDPNALVLQELMQEYKFSIAICVKLLSRSFHSQSMRRFKEGKFEVVDNNDNYGGSIIYFNTPFITKGTVQEADSAGNPRPIDRQKGTVTLLGVTESSLEAAGGRKIRLIRKTEAAIRKQVKKSGKGAGLKQRELRASIRKNPAVIAAAGKAKPKPITTPATSSGRPSAGRGVDGNSWSSATGWI